MKHELIDKIVFLLGWGVVFYGVFGGTATLTSGGTVLLGLVLVTTTYD